MSIERGGVTAVQDQYGSFRAGFGGQDQVQQRLCGRSSADTIVSPRNVGRAAFQPSMAVDVDQVQPIGPGLDATAA